MVIKTKMPGQRPQLLPAHSTMVSSQQSSRCPSESSIDEVLKDVLVTWDYRCIEIVKSSFAPKEWVIALQKETEELHKENRVLQNRVEILESGLTTFGELLKHIHPQLGDSMLRFPFAGPITPSDANSSSSDLFSEPHDHSHPKEDIGDSRTTEPIPMGPFTPSTPPRALEAQAKPSPIPKALSLQTQALFPRSTTPASPSQGWPNPFMTLKSLPLSPAATEHPANQFELLENNPGEGSTEEDMDMQEADAWEGQEEQDQSVLMEGVLDRPEA